MTSLLAMMKDICVFLVSGFMTLSARANEVPLRVGHAQTQAEAKLELAELKKSYPDLAVYPFLAKHLKLDLNKIQNADGEIDESFVTGKTREAMLVFGKGNPYPNEAVKPNTQLPSQG